MRRNRLAWTFGVALGVLSLVSLAWSGPLTELVTQGAWKGVRFGASEGEIAGQSQQGLWGAGLGASYTFTDEKLAIVRLNTSGLEATMELLHELEPLLGRSFTEADARGRWQASAALADLRWIGAPSGQGVLTVVARGRQPEPLPPAVVQPGGEGSSTPASGDGSAVQPPAEGGVQPPDSAAAASEAAAGSGAPDSAEASASEASAAGPAVPGAGAAAPGPEASAAAPAAAEDPAAEGQQAAAAAASAAPVEVEEAPLPPAEAAPGARRERGEAAPAARQPTEEEILQAAAEAPALVGGDGDLAQLLRRGQFRDVKLDARIDVRKVGLQRSKRTAELGSYVRPDDLLQFDGLALAEISYVVQEGRLVAIGLRASGRKATLELAQAIDQVLGTPIESDAEEGSVTWASRQITVLMQTVPDTDDTVALVLSTARAQDQG